ncbi:MAG: hypothetical protein AVDCRST_MAG56-1371, partial [uncultured Cytophagales bacterium]
STTNSSPARNANLPISTPSCAKPATSSASWASTSKAGPVR